jgi:MFS family permease
VLHAPGASEALALGREFRLYATGQAVSIVGDRIALIALVFLVIHLSRDFALALAVFYACRVLPALLIGLLVGVLVDRFDRRRLMIACDLGRAALLVSATLLTTSTLGAIYPLTVLLYGLTLVFNAASSAALPDVVPHLRMVAANSILTGINNAADIAYAAGGVLIFSLGFQLPFYIDAATFVFSALTIRAMRVPSQSEGERLAGEGLWGNIKAGITFIRGKAFLRWHLLAMIVAPLAWGAGYVLAPLYAARSLSASPGLFGPLRSGAVRFSLLEVALGLGALLGSALAPRLASRYGRGRVFCLSLVGTGIADGLLSATGSLYLAAPFLAVSGMFFSLVMITGITVAQIMTPTEVRGRVQAARSTVGNSATLLGSAVAGLALFAVSVRALWAIEGAVVVLIGLIVSLQVAVRSQP